MAHRNSQRTFHKKTMKARKQMEEARIAEEAAAHPVTVRKATPEEMALFRQRRAGLTNPAEGGRAELNSRRT